MGGIGQRSSLLDKTYFKMGAQAIVDIKNVKVFAEVCFSWSKRFSITGSGVANIVIDGQAIGDEKVFVVLPLAITAFGSGPINIDMYFGTDADEDGTLWEGGNRNHLSVETPGTIIRLNPTINLDGMATGWEFMIPSNGVAAVAHIGGQVSEHLIFLGRKDGKYMLRLTNTGSNVVSCHFAFTIFEATEV